MITKNTLYIRIRFFYRCPMYRVYFRLGFVSFLHTSGRSLNIHPHLHVLLAERSIDKLGNKKKIHFFPFQRLK